MKTNIIFRILLSFIAVCFSFKNISAQKFEKQQPDILYAVDKHGDTTGVKVGFGTANPTEVIDVKGTVKTDTVKVSRVLPADGDSIIRLGAHSINIDINNNRISWSPIPPFNIVRGITIANGSSFALGTNSIAMGNNILNAFPNSFALGFGSGTTLFADATNVGMGTVLPITQLHVSTASGGNGFITTDPLAPTFPPVALPITDGLVVANGSGTFYRKINFANATDVLLGNGTFGPPPPPANAWLLGGNDGSNSNIDGTNNILGTLTNLDLRLVAGVGGVQRGLIDWNTGFWGIGNTSAFTPQSLLHLNQPGNPNNALYMQFTNDQTGNTSLADGFKVGINSATGATPGVPNAEIRNEEDAPITFFTGNGTTVSERMRITRGSVVTPMGTTNNNVTRIGITYSGVPIINPVSLLHLGITCIPNTFGHRLWMDAGTFTFFGSDNMYVGMKRDEEITDPLQGDVFDAVINWGDNIAAGLPGGPIGPDNLRVIFTAPLGGNLNDRNNAGGTHGLEVMRMTPLGRVGIGSVFTQPLPPHRRLDILSDFQNNPTGEPQLRLTFEQNSNVLDGTYSDFQTTQLGDLFINPNSGTVSPDNERFVGIHTANPRNTLEINSQLASATTVNPNNPSPSTGESGLRFTKLTSASTPFTNPGNGVLSVDAEGDVIYVPTNTGGGGFGTCSIPTVLADDAGIDLATHNFLFEGQGTTGYNVGIGITGCAPDAKLDVLQSSGTINSIGVKVVNMDQKSLGAYFSAPNGGYAALFVPQNGGKVNIGYPNNFVGVQGGPGLFNVDGDVYATGVSTATGNALVSDGQLKKDIVPFFSGLHTIRNIYPVSYTFNGKAGLDSSQIHIGVIAEDIASIAPFAVDTFLAFLEQTDSTPTPLLSVKTEAIMYTTINAVKELDSTVTTLLPPPPTTLISPANGDTGLPVFTNITLVWHSAPNANAYTINIVSATDPTQRPFTITLSDTTYYGYRTKSCSHTFNWWVVTENNNGRSDKSEVWSFTTTGPGTATPPILASPNNGDTNTLGVQFGWFPVSNAENYSLFLSASPNEAELISTYWTSDTIINATLPFDNFTYFWWIKAYNCSGESVGSEIRSFYARSYVPPPAPEYPSDSAYKINVTPIDSALEKVMQLSGVNFDWNRTQFPQMNFDSIRAMGFIAQQVQPIVPEVVHQNDTGALSLDYARMVALLVEAIKQQQATISGLQTALANSQVESVDSQFQAITSQISQMQSCIDNLPPGMCGNARMANPDLTNENDRRMSQQINLISSGGAILYQNEPNPFGSSTIIRYYVPENTREAVLVFYDEFGREISKEPLLQNGYSKVDINAEKLAAGIYTYSIIVDGKVADTKKMMRTKN